MSKKELLNETQIRRFMKLANLEPLAKNVLSEGDGQIPQDAPDRRAPARSEDEARLKEEMGMEDEAKMPSMEEEMDMQLDSGESEEDTSAAGVDAKAVVKATVDALMAGLKQAGLDVGDISVEDEGGEDTGAEMDMGGEEAGEEEDEEEGEDESEEEQEEMDETASASLSEDALVEAVLTRVTARLMEEAKKAKAKKAKKSVPAKMAAKAAAKPAEKKEKEEEKKTLEEATSAEGGGPLLKQGKNKYDVYKGHADMTMAKGDKGGKGGHSLETVTAKAEHTVTHGGKNLATLGGNKKKV